MKKFFLLAVVLVITISAVTLSKDVQKKPAITTIKLITAKSELSKVNTKPVKSNLGNGDGSIL
jgi:hypothetical protein